MKKKTKNNSGTSLIEVLVSVAIMAVVIVSILTGFSQQQLLERKTTNKNAAVMLAEIKMEELMKYSSTQLTGLDINTEYITVDKGVFTNYDTNPMKPNQFRRSVTITSDILNNLVTVVVRVEYGAFIKGAVDKYPFNVSLRTDRGR